MAEPTVRFRLPDGTARAAGPDALVGRSGVAAVRIDDPRVSTVHAELSWRESGFVLLARGGRLVVAGRPVSQVAVAPGIEIGLAPGVSLLVEEVLPGDAPVVPPTAGKERLRFWVGVGIVRLLGPTGDPVLELGGIGAAILTALLRTPGPVPWDRLAEELWPDEGAIRRATAAGEALTAPWTEVDERRFRNRFDQQLANLRRALEPLRTGGALRVAKGQVEVVLQPLDQVEHLRP